MGKQLHAATAHSWASQTLDLAEEDGNSTPLLGTCTSRGAPKPIFGAFRVVFSTPFKTLPCWGWSWNLPAAVVDLLGSVLEPLGATSGLFGCSWGLFVGAFRVMFSSPIKTLPCWGWSWNLPAAVVDLLGSLLETLGTTSGLFGCSWGLAPSG